MPRQYLADFIARASAWFHFEAPDIPQEAAPWILAVDYFEAELHAKYGVYESHTDAVLFFRRPQAHEIEQDIHDYSRLVTARVRTFELPTKRLLESILAELPDPAEFKEYIDRLIDGSDSDSISEVSDDIYISDENTEGDYDINADNAIFLDDFMTV